MNNTCQYDEGSPKVQTNIPELIKGPGRIDSLGSRHLQDMWSCAISTSFSVTRDNLNLNHDPVVQKYWQNIYWLKIVFNR